MDSERYDFGMVIYHSEKGNDNNIIQISAFSNCFPRFVNKIDEQLWIESWEKQSKKLGIEYIHNQGRFDKVKRNAFGFSKNLASSFGGDMVSLIKSYYAAATKYNQEISEPFINERRNLLNTIFEY